MAGKRKALLDSLEECQNRFSTDLEFLKEFFEEMTQGFRDTETASARARSQMLTDDEREDFERMLSGDWVTNLSSDRIKGLLTKHRDYFFGRLKMLHKLGKYQQYIIQLTLVHMLTLLEAFARNYLTLLYHHFPDSLNRSKVIAVSEVLKAESIDNLRDVIVARELYAVGKRFPENLHKHLMRFGIDPTLSHSDRDALESYKRFRDRVVHEYELVDDALVPETLLMTEADVSRAIKQSQTYLHSIHKASTTRLKLTDHAIRPE
jgi:uncharacterized protein YutE (UPF0331/DUF86 family)